MSKTFAVIIPARWASTRFPGKPLAMIDGQMMVRRVYERASEATPLVWVATDDARIYDAVEGFGGRAVMTSANHRSGTDRCAEAVGKIEDILGKKIDFVINVQGDEPFISREQIELLRDCFKDPDVCLATLIRKVGVGEQLTNPNQVKVVVAGNMDALYFSRSPVPYIRDAAPGEWTGSHTFYKHIGMYGYRTDVLRKITKLPAGLLEMAESLEQNRWLENGYRIRCAVTDHESVGIDTLEDLDKITGKSPGNKNE
jgi:3-deoxy-manno-octulosonate cytidylyltransferase (CMP-KDO synthetase)